MKKIFIFLLFFVITAYGYSQVFLISTQGTVTSCIGDFFDSGGSGGNYGDNENYIQTYHTTSITNTHIRMTFANFNVEPGDTLIVYDGSTTAAPIIGKYNNNNLPPSFIDASLLNVSGDLTYQFKSNASLNAAGWMCTAVCIVPCQTILATLHPLLTIPHPNDSNYIDICIGNTITFAARGSGPNAFPEAGLVYTQDSTTCTYNWDFGDGNTGTGQIVTHTYTQVRGFDVTLSITDDRLCTNVNSLGARVRISQSPFAEINPLPDMCSTSDTSYITLGYNSQSVIVIQPVVSSQAASQRYDSTMFIPDGGACSPSCYNTFVTFNDFLMGQTITSANDVLSICMSIEHSFAGDLSFQIFCPNGQSVILDSYDNSGGSFLGQAYEPDASNPCSPVGQIQGVPWVYGWSSVYGQQGLLNTCDAGTSPIPAADTINHTNYFTPQYPLSGLIGCPLNGTWNLQICDTWASDNGYIFWWELNLNPLLLPQGWSYEVPIDTVTWTGSFFTILNDTTIRVIPDSGGIFQYTVTVYDIFGCSYDTTLNIQVVQTPVYDIGHDTTLCGNNLSFPLSPGSGYSAYAWSTGETTDTIHIASTNTYYVTATNTNLAGNLNCVTRDSVYIKVLQMPQPINLGPDLCTPVAVILDAGNAGLHYIWSIGDTTQTISVTGSGQYTVSVADEFGNNCEVLGTVHISKKPTPFDLGPDTCTITTDVIVLDAQNPGFQYIWSTGSNAQTINVWVSDIYAVTVTDDPGHNCDFSDSINIRKIPKPDIEIGPDTTMCSFAYMRMNVGETDGQNYLDQNIYTYLWSPGGQTTRGFDIECSTPGEVTTYSVSVTGCVTVTDARTVTAKLCELTLPNIITPNNDGFNDFFKVDGIDDFPGSNLKVYNRWGKKIYESDDYNETSNVWDGGGEAPGVYYYVLTVNYGTHGSCVDVMNYNGTITLIR
ncbi:MAG: gliding motility-associated C-terminal domain-containing protein [Bacteroidota bacterium]